MAAELQTKVARELHDHWKNFYSACDIRTIQEVCAIPAYTANYALVTTRVAAASLREFARARMMVATCQEHFCVTNADCNFLVGIEAQATVDTMNFGYRREEGVKEQLDQIRLENRRSFLGLGRGLLKTSSDAAQLAAKLGSALKGWLGSPTQGWLEFAGYLGSPQGKRFADDVIGGVRGILKGNTESPTSQTATASGTTIDNNVYEYQLERQAPALPAPSPVMQPQSTAAQDDVGAQELQRAMTDPWRTRPFVHPGSG